MIITIVKNIIIIIVIVIDWNDVHCRIYSPSNHLYQVYYKFSFHRYEVEICETLKTYILNSTKLNASGLISSPSTIL